MGKEKVCKGKWKEREREETGSITGRERWKEGKKYEEKEGEKKCKRIEGEGDSGKEKSREKQWWESEGN